MNGRIDRKRLFDQIFNLEIKIITQLNETLRKNITLSEETFKRSRKDFRNNEINDISSILNFSENAINDSNKRRRRLF